MSASTPNFRRLRRCWGLLGPFWLVAGCHSGLDASGLGSGAGSTGQHDTNDVHTTCPEGSLSSGAECGPEEEESCKGVVCNDPPADYCENNTLVRHHDEGTCEENGQPHCTYTLTKEDCDWDSECIESEESAACQETPILGTAYYIGQTAAGSGDGTSYANRMSIEAHNEATFAPGDVIYLSGPEDISSRITVSNSGAPTMPIIYRTYEAVPTTIRVTDKRNAMEMSEQQHIWIDGLAFRDGWQALSIGSSSHVRVTRNDIRNFGIPQDPVGGGGKGIFIGHSNHITIGGAPGYGNFVKGAGVDMSGGDVAVGSSDNIIISYNHLLGDPGSPQPGTDGIVFQSSTHGLIEYNTLGDHLAAHPAGEDGLDLKAASNVLVRYNIAYNNSYANYKINAVASNSKVKSSDTIIMRHNYGFNTDRHGGITISGGSTGADGSIEEHSDLYIFGNIIHGSYRARPLLSSSKGDNINIYNNIFYHDISDTDKNYANLVTRSTNTRFKNNILVSPLTERMLWTDGPELDLSNNLYFSIQGSPQVRVAGTWIDASAADAAAIIEAPLFINEQAYDFRLTEASPAANSGLVLIGTPADPPTIFVQGAFETQPTDYESSYAHALHPDTDFFDGWVNGEPSAGSFPLVVLANQGDFGSTWEVGPFVHAVP